MWQLVAKWRSKKKSWDPKKNQASPPIKKSFSNLNVKLWINLLKGFDKYVRGLNLEPMLQTNCSVTMQEFYKDLWLDVASNMISFNQS